MPALVEVASDGGVVLFEGEFSGSGLAELEEIGIRDRLQDVVAGTRASAASVADTIRTCATTVISTFEDLATRKSAGGTLKEATVELGVSVTGEGHVIVLKGSASANLKITMKWDFS